VGLQSTIAADGPLEGGGIGYIASKHGVVGLTRQYALHYARRGVRVNAVAPGYIVTAMTAMLRQTADLEQRVAKLHPMERLGRPEEIAEAALFLASDAASFITGVVLPVDGGYTAR
jgi:NAD(P)-dependent dehydrogenase (short-subunit alcohol dehydrogenase family)